MNLLKRYEPWSLLNQFHSSLNDLFETIGSVPDDTRIATGQWVPAVDIKEEKDKFLLKADLPGVDPKDIEVTMTNGVLTIRGERHSETKEESDNYFRVERVDGTFYRRFNLPDVADPDSVRASCKNGVLTVSIMKKEKAKPKKIDVVGES